MNLERRHLRSRVRRAWAGGLLLALLVLGGGGCAQQEQSAPDASADAEASGAGAVPALVGLAQSYHAQADIAVEAGDLDGALRAIEALITDLEAAEVEHPERDEMLLDAHGRLARLRRDAGDPEAALAAVRAGLERAPARPSLFAGYLHQLEGDLLREGGDDRGAVEAHRRAIEVFQAIINQEAP